jgi:ketosteroid isomerase-like protein
MSTAEDELAIRSLVARYIDAVNRYNQQDWAATWSETATWNLMGMEVVGREAIVSLWSGAMGSFDFAIMMLNSGTLDIDGDTATGRWYITEHTKPSDGDPAVVLGVYDDRYVKEDGAWVFAGRHYNVMYQGPADYSGNYQPYRPE